MRDAEAASKKRRVDARPTALEAAALDHAVGPPMALGLLELKREAGTYDESGKSDVKQERPNVLVRQANYPEFIADVRG